MVIFIHVMGATALEDMLENLIKLDRMQLLEDKVHYAEMSNTRKINIMQQNMQL